MYKLHKLTKSFIILAIFFITSLAYADVTADLNNLLTQTKTMQANFTQTILDNHKKTVQQTTGSMALSRPGKFRWEVKQPIPQIIIANANRLWIYDPDLEQVTIRSLAKAANGTPAFLLSQTNTSLDTQFNVQAINKNQAGWRWFQLTPKQKDASFTMIQFGFQGNQMQQMRLTDTLGHTTQIIFQNIKTNGALSDSLFIFKPQGKVDTIDETKQKQ